MTMSGAALSVTKSVTVNVPIDRAFSVFTERLRDWWPMATHHLGTAPMADGVIEPVEGGRVYEKDAVGTECTWGRVLVWQPPARFMFVWQINADWVHDPSIDSTVDVRFIAEGPQQTRVELEHAKLEAFGERAPAMRDAFDGDGGWQFLLDAFRDAADRA